MIINYKLFDRVSTLGEFAKVDYKNILIALLNAVGYKGDPEELLKTMLYEGMLNLTSIRNIMRRIQYSSHLINIKVVNLKKDMLPCVYLEKHKTAFVIVNIDEDYVDIINEKNEKIKKLSKSISNGKAIIFMEVEEVNRANKSYKKNWISEIISSFKWVALSVLFFSFIINVCALFTPLYVMKVYDTAVIFNAKYALGTMTVGIIIAITLSQVMMFLRSRVVALIDARLKRVIYEMMMRKIFYFPIGALENDEISRQLSWIKGFEEVKDFFSKILVIILFDAPFSIMFLLVIGYFHMVLAAIPLVMILLYAIIFLILTSKVKKVVLTTQDNTVDFQALELEVLTGLFDIKVYNGEKMWINKFRRAITSNSYETYKSNCIDSMLSFIHDFIMTSTGLTLVVVGAILAMENEISQGVLIATMMLAWKVLIPINSFFVALPGITKTYKRLNQLSTFAAMETENDSYFKKKIITQLRGDLKFDRVSFRYKPTSKLILNNLSFEVNPGEVVVISGASESGKSTILKLILRLYNVQAGKIYLNGINVNQVSPLELRSMIGYMPKKIDIFSDSIANNISLFGLKSAHKIHEAAILSGIYDEIISLPDKFETILGQGGRHNLDPSFIQKIGLARVYAQSPKIMLFDRLYGLKEDDYTKIINSINYFRGRTTIIMVSNNKSLLRLADKTMVMDQGNSIYFDKFSNNLVKGSF